MSQTILEPETDRSADRDERLMAGLGYVLILLGNIIGVTTLIAVIIAYARKDTAPAGSIPITSSRFAPSGWRSSASSPAPA
ncbi:hypothetical protein [Maricaulis sp.]|uniref:hypothetical protein n=1 Tax=Maricaulis sp. TaxID=1486257 RepID=UPI003A8E26A6